MDKYEIYDILQNCDDNIYNLQNDNSRAYYAISKQADAINGLEHIYIKQSNKIKNLLNEALGDLPNLESNLDLTNKNLQNDAEEVFTSIEHGTNLIIDAIEENRQRSLKYHRLLD